MAEDKFEECFQCGEPAKCIPTFNNKTKELDEIYFCFECDRTFMITEVDGNPEVGILPFDSKMQIIVLECDTKECEYKSNYSEHFIYIVNDMMIYKQYCHECAIKILKKEYPGKDITRDNVNTYAEVHSMEINNKVLNDPKQLEKVMKSETMKAFYGKFQTEVEKQKKEMKK